MTKQSVISSVVVVLACVAFAERVFAAIVASVADVAVRPVVLPPRYFVLLPFDLLSLAAAQPFVVPSADSRRASPAASGTSYRGLGYRYSARRAARPEVDRERDLMTRRVERHCFPHALHFRHDQAEARTCPLPL
jgi:hypothetical protein